MIYCPKWKIRNGKSFLEILFAQYWSWARQPLSSARSTLLYPFQMLNAKQSSSNSHLLTSFGMMRPGIEPTTSRLWGGRSTDWANTHRLREKLNWMIREWIWMVIFTARQNLANLNEVKMNLIVKFANLAGKSYNSKHVLLFWCSQAVYSLSFYPCLLFILALHLPIILSSTHVNVNTYLNWKWNCNYP